MKEYSYTKKALLRELSHDSRTPVTTLAKRLKCSRNTIISNMEALEKEFDIKYTLNLNKERLGLMQNQIWSIKFGIKPSIEDIKNAFKDDTFAQFVAITEGDFDLLMLRKTPENMVVGSGEKYTAWTLNTALSLLKFKPSVATSIVVMVHTGFTPIESDLIDKLDTRMLSIDQLDKKILMLLNDDSRMSYSAMAKKLGKDVETIRYRFRKLKKNNTIRMYTIVLRKPPTDYNVAFLINYELAPGLVERYTEAQRYYIDIDKKLPLINTFQYLALTNGSFLLFGIGCFESEEKAIKGTVVAHKDIYAEDNPKISYARIKHVVKGHIPIRNIDLEAYFAGIKWGNPGKG